MFYAGGEWSEVYGAVRWLLFLFLHRELKDGAFVAGGGHTIEAMQTVSATLTFSSWGF